MPWRGEGLRDLNPVCGSIEHAFALISIIIIYCFATELALLIFGMGTAFFCNGFYMLDFVVILCTIIFDILFHGSPEDNILILLRSWRFVRIIHGVYAAEVEDAEVRHKEEEEEHKAEELRASQEELRASHAEEDLSQPEKGLPSSDEFSDKAQRTLTEAEAKVEVGAKVEAEAEQVEAAMATVAAHEQALGEHGPKSGDPKNGARLDANDAGPGALTGPEHTEQPSVTEARDIELPAQLAQAQAQLAQAQAELAVARKAAEEAKYAADAEIERLNRALQEAIKGQEDATMDKFGDPLSGSKASTNVSELPDSVSNKRCC